MNVNQRSSLRKSLNIMEIDENKKDLRVSKYKKSKINYKGDQWTMVECQCDIVGE